jgi:hypothetical protein
MGLDACTSSLSLFLILLSVLSHLCIRIEDFHFIYLVYARDFNIDPVLLKC